MPRSGGRDREAECAGATGAESTGVGLIEPESRPHNGVGRASLKPRGSPVLP